MNMPGERDLNHIDVHMNLIIFWTLWTTVINISWTSGLSMILSFGCDNYPLELIKIMYVA